MAKFLRSWFGIQALMFASASVYAVLRAAQNFDGKMLLGLQPRIRFLFCALVACTVVTGTAWWKLRRGQESGRAWAIGACLLNLPLFGLGTLVGVTGLAVFTRRDIVTQMAAELAAQEAASQSRVTGDGTSKWMDVLSVVGQVLIFAAGSAFWRQWAAYQGLPHPKRFTWLVLYEGALLFTILCHELGHLVFGWLAQMKLRQFIVGPFEWLENGGAWKFKFDAVGLWGRGMAGMSPLHLRNLASRSIFMMVGGPVASLLLGSIAALLTLSAKGHPWAPMWEFLSILATLSLGQFLINLLPLMPYGQHYSDGAQIYQLASRGPWGDVHLAFAMVSSTAVTAQRPRDYDIRVIERAAAFLTHGHKGMLLRMFACFHYLDSGRKKDGIDALRSAEAIYPEIAASIAADQHAEFVFINALYKRDRGRARLWWDKMQAKGESNYQTGYWKARTALSWIEGRMEDAQEAWQKGNAVARAKPRTGVYDFERWCFEELHRAMEEGEAAQGDYSTVMVNEQTHTRSIAQLHAASFEGPVVAR